MALEYLVNYNVSLWSLISAETFHDDLKVVFSTLSAVTVRSLFCNLLFICTTAISDTALTYYYIVPANNGSVFAEVQYRNLISQSVG